VSRKLHAVGEQLNRAFPAALALAATVLRIGAAAGGSFLRFFLAPVPHGRNSTGWLNNGRPIGADLSYVAGVMLLFLVALLDSWELLVRSILQPSKHRERNATQEPVRINTGSVINLLVSLLLFTALSYGVMVATV